MSADEAELRKGLRTILTGYDPDDDAPGMPTEDAKRSKNRTKRKKLRARKAKQEKEAAAKAALEAKKSRKKKKKELKKQKAQGAVGSSEAVAEKKAEKGQQKKKNNKKNKKKPAAAPAASLDGDDGDDDVPMPATKKQQPAQQQHLKFGAGGATHAVSAKKKGKLGMKQGAAHNTDAHAGAGDDADIGGTGFSSFEFAANAARRKQLRHEEQLVTYTAGGGGEDAGSMDDGLSHWFLLPGASDTMSAKKSRDGRVKKRKQVDAEALERLQGEAEAVLEADVEVWRRNRGLEGPSQDRWLQQVLKGGTMSDKIAALALLVRESPIHTLAQLDALLNMAHKKSRRESGPAIDALWYVVCHTMCASAKLCCGCARCEVKCSEPHLYVIAVWFYLLSRLLPSLFLFLFSCDAVLLPSLFKSLVAPPPVPFHRSLRLRRSELFVHTLLPQRKLRTFASQPGLPSLERRRVKKQGGDLTDDDRRRLVVWFYESALKDRVARWADALSMAVYNDLEYHKTKAIKAAAAMLANVPEREAAFLTMLVAKLGDKARRVASAVSYQLNQLMEMHPNMRPVILRELRQFMHRTTITPRARYYAVICLNQMVRALSTFAVDCLLCVGTHMWLW